jgi:hypothetical protein
VKPDALRGMTLACLITCAVALVWPPASALGLIAAIPLALVVLAGIRPGRRWGGWVAVVTIPYLAVGAMNIVAGPMAKVPSLGLGIGAALAFVLGLGWTRSIGATLKG